MMHGEMMVVKAKPVDQDPDHDRTIEGDFLYGRQLGRQVEIDDHPFSH